jgi:hypothetical protein
MYNQYKHNLFPYNNLFNTIFISTFPSLVRGFTQPNNNIIPDHNNITRRASNAFCRRIIIFKNKFLNFHFKIQIYSLVIIYARKLQKNFFNISFEINKSSIYPKNNKVTKEGWGIEKSFGNINLNT